MNHIGFFGMVLLGSMAVACSGSDAADGDSPVATTALAGSIGGKAFKAVSATARSGFDDDGTRSITIYETEVDCDTRGEDDGRKILTSAPWKDGFESAFSLNQNATLYTPPGDNNVATQGRIEIIKAGADGEEGKLRLRAYIDDDNQVEGEVTVKVCSSKF